MNTIATTRPRRRFGLGWLVVCLLLLLVTTGALWEGLDLVLHTWGGVPINLTIDGEPVLSDFEIGVLDEGERFAVVAVLLMVMLLLALLLPVLLLVIAAIVLLAVVLSLAAAVGGPVLAIAMVLAAAGLLVVLPLVLLWRALRWLLRDPKRAPPRPALPPPSATIDS